MARRRERLSGGQATRAATTRNFLEGDESTAAFGSRRMPNRANTSKADAAASSAPSPRKVAPRTTGSRIQTAIGRHCPLAGDSCMSSSASVNNAFHRNGVRRAPHRADRAADAAVFVLQDRRVLVAGRRHAPKSAGGSPRSRSRGTRPGIGQRCPSFRHCVGHTSTQPPQSTQREPSNTGVTPQSRHREASRTACRCVVARLDDVSSAGAAAPRAGSPERPRGGSTRSPARGR